MADWRLSRHKPRLLGEVKEEFVYLNLCSDHSFLSPNYNRESDQHVPGSKSASMMRELRESLRQAALINIVAAVNEGDGNKIEKGHLKTTDNIDIRTNQSVIIHQSTSVKRQGTTKTRVSKTLKIRRPELRVQEPQRLCPKLKLPCAVLDFNNNKELSILEGRQIESTRGLKASIRNKIDVNGDSYVESNGSGSSNETYNNLDFKRTRPLIPNLTGRKTEVNKIVSERNQNVAVDFDNTDTCEQNVDQQLRDYHSTRINSLHISTKEGDIGRSAGYFPPPSSLIKRDVSPTKSVLSKCDAVDILEASPTPCGIDSSLSISSQRDHCCGVGLKRTTSLPSVPSKLKRLNQKTKKEKEIIILSAPIGRQIKPCINNLGDGIIGVNIAQDPNQNMKIPLSSKTAAFTDNDSERSSSASKTRLGNSITADSIYYLSEDRDSTSPKPSSLISLEGRGLPHIHVRTTTLPTPHQAKSEHSIKQELPNIASGDHRKEPLPVLSNQVYDFNGLGLNSNIEDGRNTQNINMIQPIIRKASLPNLSVSGTPRPRPINASLSSSKQVEETIKYTEPQVLETSVHKPQPHVKRDTHLLSEDTDNTPNYPNSNKESSHVNSRDLETRLSVEQSESNNVASTTNQTQTTRKLKPIPVVAKNQGPSSMNTNCDKLTKLQVIKDTDGGPETTVKILKSFDQDLYADFTHRKHRNSNLFSTSDPDTSKVAIVKVKCFVSTQNEENSHDGSDESDSDFLDVT